MKKKKKGSGLRERKEEAYLDGYCKEGHEGDLEKEEAENGVNEKQR